MEKPFDPNIIVEFEKLLNRCGIKVADASNLEEAFLALYEFSEYKFGDTRELILPVNPQVLKKAIFLYDLAIKLIPLESNPSFKFLIPHLKLLNDCGFTQNDSNSDLLPIQIEYTNKIWELYLAIALISVYENVVLSDPFISDGNPDITCNINGRTTSFACKVPNTEIFKAESYIDLMDKGWDQIEKYESANFGTVCFNFKNVFLLHKDYIIYELVNDKYLYKVSTELNEIVKDVENFFVDIQDSIYRDNESKYDLVNIWDKYNKHLRFNIHYVSTCAIVWHNNNPTPMNYKRIHAFLLAKDEQDRINNLKEYKDACEIIRKINDAFY
jgi:hypothetical protein